MTTFGVTTFGKITADTILSLLKGISRLSADERAKIVDDLWKKVKNNTEEYEFYDMDGFYRMTLEMGLDRITDYDLEYAF